MLRQLIYCVMVFAGAIGTVNADHFYLYHPRPVFAQPVVGYSPVVTYQPAYVVPTVSYGVTQVPVTTVSYAGSYYAPLVPTVPIAPVVYSAPYYAAPAYYGLVYGGSYGQRVHSRLNVHRNGSYNLHLRVR